MKKGLTSLLILAFLSFGNPLSAGSIAVATGGSGTISRGRGSGSIAMTPEVLSNPCAGTFTSDSFTESGSGNVNLATHSLDEGATWQGANASDGSLVINRTNDEVNSTNTGGVYKTSYSGTVPACANYTVSISAKTGTSGSSHKVGVLGRWSAASSGNGYRFLIEGDGTARLQKIVNGATTDLGTHTISGFAAGGWVTYYTIELRMNGTSIAGYVGGILQVIVTDSTFASAGTAGIMLRNGNVRMTSFSVTYT